MPCMQSYYILQIFPMKYALALILACCVLISQDKPAAKAPTTISGEKSGEALPKIQRIIICDELIELIHSLKKDAGRAPYKPPYGIGPEAAAMYEAEMRAKSEAQRLLLQALVELAKEAQKAERTKVYHSSNPWGL